VKRKTKRAFQAAHNVDKASGLLAAMAPTKVAVAAGSPPDAQPSISVTASADPL